MEKELWQINGTSFGVAEGIWQNKVDLRIVIL